VLGQLFGQSRKLVGGVLGPTLIKRHPGLVVLGLGTILGRPVLVEQHGGFLVGSFGLVRVADAAEGAGPQGMELSETARIVDCRELGRGQVSVGILRALLVVGQTGLPFEGLGEDASLAVAAGIGGVGDCLVGSTHEPVGLGAGQVELSPQVAVLGPGLVRRPDGLFQ